MIKKVDLSKLQKIQGTLIKPVAVALSDDEKPEKQEDQKTKIIPFYIGTALEKEAEKAKAKKELFHKTPGLCAKKSKSWKDGSAKASKKSKVSPITKK